MKRSNTILIFPLAAMCLSILFAGEFNPAVGDEFTRTARQLGPQSSEGATNDAESFLTVFEPLGLPYIGKGRVFVLNDGAMVVQIANDNGDSPLHGTADAESWNSFAFLLQGDGLHLVDAGGHWSIQANAVQAAPSGTSASIPLGAAGERAGGGQRHSVLEIEGVLSLEAETGASPWSIHLDIAGDSGQFATRLNVDPRTGPVQEGGGCVASCNNGECETSSNCLVGICWCGLFGEPWCICVAFKLFAVAMM